MSRGRSSVPILKVQVRAVPHGLAGRSGTFVADVEPRRAGILDEPLHFRIGLIAGADIDRPALPVRAPGVVRAPRR